MSVESTWKLLECEAWRCCVWWMAAGEGSVGCGIGWCETKYRCGALLCIPLLAAVIRVVRSGGCHSCTSSVVYVYQLIVG